MENQKMAKAYDLKALGEKIKARAAAKGIHMAEETVEVLGEAVYMGFMDWAKESADVSDTKLDDIAAKFYGYADQYVLPQIKAIDLDGDGK